MIPGPRGLADHQNGGDPVDLPELQGDGLDVEADRAGDRDRPGGRIGEQGDDVERIDAAQDADRDRDDAEQEPGSGATDDGPAFAEAVNRQQRHGRQDAGGAEQAPMEAVLLATTARV